MSSPLQVTTGARSDLQQATSLARHMIAECGMSEDIGPIYAQGAHASSDTERRIDGEVARVLKEAYARVTSILVNLCSSRRSPIILLGSGA